MGWDWECIAPTIVVVAGILALGGVPVLRPPTKRLGALVEEVARRRARVPPGQVERLENAVDAAARRMDLMEERQDFAERLIEGARGARKGEGPASRERRPDRPPRRLSRSLGPLSPAPRGASAVPSSGRPG